MKKTLSMFTLTATTSYVHDFEVGTLHDHNVNLTGRRIVAHRNQQIPKVVLT